MEAACQRCHETLREDDRYCHVCGLPQLTYLAADTPALTLDEGAIADLGGAGFSGLGAGIAWKPAIKAALILAVPAGLLCSGLTPIGPSLGLVWMGGAAAWAVGLYLNRARTERISSGMGARIGLLTGVLASWLTLGVNGAALWVKRFVLHQGGQMDSLWATEVDASQQLSRQLVNQMGLTAAQAAQSTEISRAWMLSAEGRAGVALTNFLAGAVFLICFAMVGGALGARFMGQPRRPRA